MARSRWSLVRLVMLSLSEMSELIGALCAATEMGSRNCEFDRMNMIDRITENPVDPVNPV